MLVLRLQGLKQTARTGWNKEFPDGRYPPRCVPESESVADHSWSLAMFAFAVAHYLGLDVLKMVTMALVHDVAEIVTTDIVTVGLPPEEKRRAKVAKRLMESAAMRDIFLPHGVWGKSCYDLWVEYEQRGSPEARVLKELDQMEACIQAVIYAEQGHQVSPVEWFDLAEPSFGPELTEMLTILRQRVAESSP